MKCRFNRAWAGSCGKPSLNGFCEEHLKKKCKCGRQATKECDEASSLICGEPICNSCECYRHPEPVYEPKTHNAKIDMTEDEVIELLQSSLKDK